MADSLKQRYYHCGDCGNNFPRRSFYRHIHNPGLPCKPPDTDEQEGFLQKLATGEIKNLENEDEAFFDIPTGTVDTELSEEKTAFLRDLFSSEIENLEDGEAFFDLFNSGNHEENVNEAFKNKVTGKEVDDFITFTSQFYLRWASEYNITDTALSHFLRFQSAMFSHLGTSNPTCKDNSEKLPSVLPQLRKTVGKQTNFTRYVICEQCKSRYEYKECFIEIEGEIKPRPCPHVAFPNSSKRKRCGHPLLKVSEVPTVDGKPKLVPYKEYYYQNFEEAFHKLVQRPDFEENCEKWRNKQKSKNSNIMTDLHDGQIWADFNGAKYNFFTKLRRYGVMLNLDFFQPFDHVNYSVGAIYLVVVNLQLEERYKKENVILVGLIPKFDKEPSTNPFLDPLVKELLKSWTDGFYLTCFSSPEKPLKFKVALLCCACDLPASRKVCGFLGHMANKGCNKCYKVFPGAIGEKRYGGFDRENWPLRDEETHREDVEYIQATAQTAGEKRSLESELGVRYSVLLKLPYFDPIRMVIIDPMHNLFLGTGKHQIRVWKDTGLLKPIHFAMIQAHIDQMECPSDIGRIPHKIGSGFAKLTADQLKNWILLFSLSALKDILPEDNFKNWQKFVIICKYLCSRVIDKTTLISVDGMILNFCRRFEELYGQASVTPNMHLHCHLKQCILDFGPIHAFWLYAFERFNGWFEKYSTNKRHIEGQLYRKFVMDVSLSNMQIVHLDDTRMQSVMQEFQISKKRGSLLSQSREDPMHAISMCTTQCIVHQTDWSVPESDVQVIKVKTTAFSDMETYHLKSMYQYIYPQQELQICPSYGSTKFVKYRGYKLGSRMGRSYRSSTVYANWSNEKGDINTTHLSTTNRPGIVEEYMVHKVICHEAEMWHLLARVSWHAALPQSLAKKLKNLAPTEQWSPLYVVDGPARFIPVQRIKCTAVSHKEEAHGKDIQVITPRQRYLVCE